MGHYVFVQGKIFEKYKKKKIILNHLQKVNMDLSISDQTYSITSLYTTQQNKNIFINWDTPADVNRCIAYYRVAYFNDDDEFPTDVYTTSLNYTLVNAVPCKSYRISVRPIAVDYTEGNLVYKNQSTDGSGKSFQFLYSYFFTIP